MSPRAQEEVASDAQGLRQPPKAPKGWRPHPGLELRDGRGLEPRPIGKLGLAKFQGSPLLPEPVSKGEHNDGRGLTRAAQWTTPRTRCICSNFSARAGEMVVTAPSAFTTRT